MIGEPFMKKVVLLVIMFGLLTGCAGNITGKVYLDSNANNLHEAEEKGIAKAEFVVTRDNVPIGTGETDEEGNLGFSTGGDSGLYCISVEKTSPKYISKGIAAGKGGACSKDADCGSGLFCSDGKCAVIGEGGECNTGADCADGLICSNGTCKTEETKKNETPVPPTQPFKACVKIDGYSSKETLDIPVTLDIDATMDKAPTPAEKEVIAGSTFEWKIYYPKSCTLLPVQLPEELLPVGSAIGDVSLDIALLQLDESRDTSGDIKSYSLEQDDLEMIKVKLKAPFKSGNKGDIKVSLTPQVICSDNQTKNLKKTTFVISYSPQKQLNIVQSSSGAVQFGGKVTLITKVENSGTIDWNGSATLVITPPKYSKNIVPGSFCQTLIQKVQCKITKIAAGSTTQEFKVTFTLPSAADFDDDYHSVISTELNFSDGSSSIKADDMSIDLLEPNQD